MKKFFFILTIMTITAVVACSNHEKGTNHPYNQKASLSGFDTLPFNPLYWKVITSMIDKNKNTMSTLYGNDMAVSYARSEGKKTYPKGAELSLVTWKKQEDRNWFGAEIPARIKSIEHIIFDSDENSTAGPVYESFTGIPLRICHNIDTNIIAERIAYISGQKTSVIP